LTQLRYSTGASTALVGSGIYMYNFNTTGKYVYVVYQLSHAWKPDSALKPHIHIIPVFNTGANAHVQFNLEYQFVPVNGTIGATTTTITTGDVNVSTFNNQHKILPFTTDITPVSNNTLSGIIICKLSSVLVQNLQYLWYLSLDMHYQNAYFGSRLESSL